MSDNFYENQHWQNEEVRASDRDELERKQMIELHNKRMELETWKAETVIRLMIEGRVKP